MEGRWTIYRRGGAQVVVGPDTGGEVPAVPCDDAAIDRAAVALAKFDGHHFDPDDEDADWWRRMARKALAAAGETP